MIDSTERRRDLAAVIALATISIASSTLIDAGIVCSNDGSQFALISALASGTSRIDAFLSYTHGVDYAEMDGHQYSDRPPGTAFLALPIYVVGRTLGQSTAAIEGEVVWIAILAGAAAVALVFLIARRLGCSRAGASAAAAALALCTPHRSYSATLFSHALSSALVLGTVALVMPDPGEDERARRTRRLIGGVLGGYACGVDYTNGLPIAVACVTAAWIEGGTMGARIKIALQHLAGGLIGVAPCLVYHTLVFGRPWSIPYHFDAHFAYAHSASGMYSGSFVDGFVGLLVSPHAGLIVWSPILAVALASSVLMARRAGARAAVIVLPFVALYLVTSKNLTWDAGASQDVRYLMSVLGLATLPLAWAFDWAFGTEAKDGARVRPLALAALGFLFFASAVIQIVKHNALWARDGSRWIPELARGLAGDAGPVLLGFARWAYPHPLMAALVLAVGLTAATMVRLSPTGQSAQSRS